MAKSKRALRLVDQRFFRYWQAFYMAFYSARLYVDVAKRWRGVGAFYLLCLLAFFALPLSIQYMVRFHQYVYQDFIEPFAKIPSIYIQKGKAVFDIPMPYFITNKQGQVTVIIDTTEKIKDFSADYPELIGLFTAKKMYFRVPISSYIKNDPRYQSMLPPPTIETFSWSKLSDGVFNLNHWIKHSGLLFIKNSLLISIYPFIIFSLYGLILTTIFALTLLGQITAYAFFRFKLSYFAACRLMMVASTSGICIFFVLKVCDYDTASMSLCGALLSYAYFCYGVWVVKQESQQLVYV